MTVVTIQKAQSELSDLIARAEAGEEIIIAREDRPAVRLMVVEGVKPPRRVIRKPGALACLRGTFPDDFFGPIYSEEELRSFEEKSIFPGETSD